MGRTKRVKKGVVKEKKSKKIKGKMKNWEKTFILLSLSIIFTIMGIYMDRLIYYYKRTHYIKPDSILSEVIADQVHVVYSGDGLYKDEESETYYFSGKNVNNYLYYSGRLWRIISVDDVGIKIITENSQGSLVWGNNTNYGESNIYKWLNEDKYLNSIYNKDNLVKASWCNQEIDMNDYKCDETIDGTVGLLTTAEYIRAGGVDSYINNSTYFWTLNTSNSEMDKSIKHYQQELI